MRYVFINILLQLLTIPAAYINGLTDESVASYSLKSSSSSSLNQQQQQQQPPPPFSAVCQSGIREDNTNYIYCARRQLYHVPLFSKNNVVYDELVLSDNRIAELTKSSFSRIKVKRIYLNGNPVRLIEDAAFARLENHLEELWLDADGGEPQGGRIESGLPRAVVNYLRNLNRLRLKGFLVPKLENSVFKRLNRLETLSVQFSSIEEIEPNAFDGISSTLRELYLDGNMLTSVPTEALLQLKSLRVLSLAQNAIKSLEQFSFGSYANSLLTSLTRLDMSYNGMRSVDSRAFHNFNRTLDTLALQNNEINSYSLRFVEQLGSLKELNLDFNLIARLPLGLFVNSRSLTVLSMQGNSIQFDDDESTAAAATTSGDVFAGLSSLVRLNLARNGIKLIPDGLFKPMRSLKSLHLDKNNLESGLGELAFDGLQTTLANLSLQYTRLKSASSLNWLKHFESLERLKIGFNQLTRLDFTLLNRRLFNTLTTIDAQNNRIEEIVVSEETAVALPSFDNLVEFDLTSNRLCTFSSRLLSKLPKLKNLALGQNPLECDCHLRDLFAWTRRMYDRDVVGYIQWQCEPEADDLPPRMFTSLTEAEFKCEPGRISKCHNNPLLAPSTTISSKLSSSSDVSSSNEIGRIKSNINNNKLARISNLQLVRAADSSNNILVSWELETGDGSEDSTLTGIKLHYTVASTSNTSSSNSTTQRKDLAFILDKSQRQFKIENLASPNNPDSRYTVCVSLIRYEGAYDKYCRDSDLSGDKKQPKTKSVQNQTAHLMMTQQNSEISAVMSSNSRTSSSNNNNMSGLDSHVISGLMITVLVVLIVCIFALIGFIVLYIRRCRLTEKNLKKCMVSSGLGLGSQANSGAGAYSTSTIGGNNTLSARSKANYTGALLSHTTATAVGTLAPNHHQKLIEVDVLNNKCFCTLNPSNPNWNGTNARILNCIVNASNNTNTLYNLHHHNLHNHHQMPCNCVNLISKVGDSSTVSSTVSSSDPTTTTTTTNNGAGGDMMSLGSPGGGGGGAVSNEETGWRFIINNGSQAPILMQQQQQTAADLALSTPTSFTHFILPPPPPPPGVGNQTTPYDIYNCLANNPSSSTLLVNTNLNSAVAIKRFNTHMQSVNVAHQQQQQQPPNDHVYCEIPSTLGRSSFRNVHELTTAATPSSFVNPANKNSQFIHHQFLMNNASNSNNVNHTSSSNSNRQNSSTSLLLSSSSNSSSNSTSPQTPANMANNFNNKFTNASII